MNYLSLVFGLGGQGTIMGAVQLDALLLEENKLLANVTSYAVEDGTEISDHITQQPEELTLQGVVTGASTMAFGLRGRSKLILNKELLRMMHEMRMPVTIVTGMDVYQDFAMTSANVTRNSDGDRLNIEAKFRKIIKAQLSTEEVPESNVSDTAGGGTTKQRAGPTAAKAGRVGSSGAGEAASATQRQSWAAGMAGAIGL